MTVLTPVEITIKMRVGDESTDVETVATTNGEAWHVAASIAANVADSIQAWIRDRHDAAHDRG